ncbi:DNA-binding transcriptional regulator, LysR family [Roseovarius pacificus]|uniref:DNA-binding transcriptional regulator, LysR family n=1 Tax=Roseovarius pacificus TaxID=337701 RepID=A0A1M7DBU4_9RHOB|nr:LysR family transcriptional regulator [Roseovarius pacificus]GGO56729.1 LysR family transcriptional regulator [Roseovarius pacificus]SHL77001.1 DNA-binding transcriptional regulator, LysR family [Roseovarius pacificus]
MRNLDTTTLRSFVAVADCGGVTRAAGMLHLTQSAVSMQIKRLEELLGLSLFDRNNRRVTLTASGEQLLGYARRILELNDEAVGRLTEQTFEGELVLGVPNDIVYPVIPRVLKSFNTAFPRVSVNLKSSSTVRLLEGLKKGELDLILTTEENVGPEGETLSEMQLRWTGAVDGAAWKKRPLRLAFCKYCIFRPLVLRKLEAAGIDWELAVDSDDDRAVEALTSADLAVGAYLEESIPPHLEAITPGAALPDLGVQKVNLYTRSGRDELLEELANMLRKGYGAVRPVTSVNAA